VARRQRGPVPARRSPTSRRSQCCLSPSTHLWADRFDGSLEDVFDLQDNVAIGVADIIRLKALRR
jgi:TolB-like protein